MISILNMASIAMICIGCGSDISDAKGKRCLSTEASQHVKPLWCTIFDEELERRGIQAQGRSFVTTEVAGRMCRRCFMCFDRCTKLIDSLKNCVGKAIEAFQCHDSHLFSVNQSSRAIGVPMVIPSRSSFHPPPPKRVAVDSRSPDVVVRNMYCIFI